MRNTIDILTPENVYVEYELAGLGSRFIALFIDTLIQLSMMLLTIFIMGIGIALVFVDYSHINSIIVAISIIILFVIFFGYYVFFEMLLKGQTIGKKVIKLRTIKNNGEPINIFDSFLRNLFKVLSFIPPLYFIDAIMMVYTKKYKRIGDFAANTIVVKVKNEKGPVTVSDLIKFSSTNEDIQSLNIYPVNSFEYSILKEFLERKDSLGNRRAVFAYNLNKYFMKKFSLENPYRNPYVFFEEIIKRNSI